ncbi:MAG: hypothetical protein HRU38_22025, partial [Saccharospirillaceae bacterium]|nr:hypothetical protein [Pseudomonadales bacterium]NRB81307.1 hypothetical protein [Saccharospirillaceae bacterium]
MMFNKTALSIAITSTLVLASCSGKNDDETPINSSPTIVVAYVSGDDILYATATDPEEDELTYIWSVDQTTIGTGTELPLVMAPSTITGLNDVLLTVTDSTNETTKYVLGVDFGGSEVGGSGTGGGTDGGGTDGGGTDGGG